MTALRVAMITMLFTPACGETFGAADRVFRPPWSIGRLRFFRRRGFGLGPGLWR
jgi:hypothetical protein